MVDEKQCLFIESSGLESKCLQKVHGIQGYSAFLVATRSLRFTNKIVRFQLDEEGQNIEKDYCEYMNGFINILSTCPYDPQYVIVGSSKDSFKESSYSFLKINESDSFNLDILYNGSLNDIKSICWNPIENSWKACMLRNDLFTICDFINYDKMDERKFREDGSEATSMFSIKWNQHFNGSQLLFVSDKKVSTYDCNSNKVINSFIVNKDGDFITDLDINPNSLYYLATSNENRTIKIWDTRNLNNNVFELKCHSHWVNSVRYNPVHDNLLATSSSDMTVGLNFIKVQNESSKNIQSNESQKNNDINQKNLEVFEEEENQESISNGVFERRTEHENTVCAVEWSSFDPWIYASLSTEGCFILGSTSNELKLQILL